MDKKIRKLLAGYSPNNIFPFLWMHGEDESTLREYMGAIADAGMRAVCVESRPHPDFMGEGWWRDMDIILDEAIKRGMHVWILDDSHFPTGFANGALQGATETLCRQSLVYADIPCTGRWVDAEIADSAPTFVPTLAERYMLDASHLRSFSDDTLLGVLAVKQGGEALSDILDLSEYIAANRLCCTLPSGEWRIYAMYLTRNRGPHRDYINMMSQSSCKVLIDAVYEPHYAHYKNLFGSTIAGFFSDEPEIGNGHLYDFGKQLYEMDDQAWSAPLETILRRKWGENFLKRLPLLWEQNFSSDCRAKARADYMDALTRLVQKNFSEQIGNWCRCRGVEYIGHLIEDNNQDTRTASGLGHFFRGIAGQDMSGIDDIGGQVLPQGEWSGEYGIAGQYRNGLFFHYVLGRLGASAAEIDPLKKGRAMCEIFGNYGWEEGVRLEKYLADHFLVRGINRFVPHAFSPKFFPDPDCPPHFYAHGHNPLYRHFGELIRYINRQSELFSDGSAITPVAILYRAESEWMSGFVPPEQVVGALAEEQINYTFLPNDVFLDRAKYQTRVEKSLFVNQNEYRCFLIQGGRILPKAALDAANEMFAAGGKVWFLDEKPQGAYDGERVEEFCSNIPVIATEKVAEILPKNGIWSVRVKPADKYIRCLHYKGETERYLIVNEGVDAWEGEIFLPTVGECCAYNVWENRAEILACTAETDGTRIFVCLQPLKSLTILFDMPDQVLAPLLPRGEKVRFGSGWKRSVCKSIEYPAFREYKEVSVPDMAAEEYPNFSGFFRYDRSFRCTCKPSSAILEITDAYEGVEVFINGIGLGIQVAKPFLYDLTEHLVVGVNTLCIEVATTLERELAYLPDPKRIYLGLGAKVVETPSGLSGEVNIYIQK